MGNTCERWLGCCCFGGAEEKPASLQFVRSKNRNCTDVLFLILYLVSWIGAIIVITQAISKGGDPKRILYGQNWNGTICGTGNQEHASYAAWVALPQSPAQINQCDDCSEILTCISDCSQTLTDPYIINHYESESFMHYCIPKLNPSNSTNNSSLSIDFPFQDEFDSASMLASRAFVDVYTIWPVILVAAFVALLLAFVYGYLTTKAAGLLIWTTFLLVIGGGFLLSYALLKQAAAADDTVVSTRSKALKGIGIAAAVCSVILLLIVIALRKRIMIAVEVVKEASRAILDVPGMLLAPIVPFALGCGYFVLFIATIAYIASVWTNTTTTLPPYILNANVLPSTTYVQHDWNQSMKNSFAYVFLHLLWTIQFLIYFTFMTIAGCIANWYFTPRDAQGNKIRGSEEGQLSRFPTLAAFYRTFRFHLGTVAFAALIIAVVQFIRALVKYIEEVSTPKNGPPNRVQRCVFCCIQCCLACMQYILDKISKNALVWSAIYGDAFGPSACSSFALIWSNLLRVAALNLVAPFIMFVGKILVSLVTTGAAMLAAYHIYDRQVSSLVVPAVTVFLLSYLVVSLFMSLLDTTTSTVLLCFLVDEKFNKASGTMLASAGLQQVINAHADINQQVANREQQKVNARLHGLEKEQPPTMLAPAAMSHTPVAVVTGTVNGNVTSAPSSFT